MLRRKKEKEEKGKEGEKKSSEVKEAIAGLIYGMSAHAVTRQMLKTRMYLEHLFMLITLGDMMGIPILPPYYSLKLLPYAVPNVKTWKRSMLKERDVTDMLY
ncbi:MAG: hypothetical protein ACP5KE_06465 [Candidatus Methanodesulfokora sp.]